MIFLRAILVAIFLLMAVPTWAQESAPPADEEAKLATLLEEGARFAAAGKPTEAISYFDKVAAAYEQKFQGSKVKIACPRWSVESLMYLLEAANSHTETEIVSVNWANAYYLKAYSLTDLGQVSAAKELLQKAIALAPLNAQFLSELGNVYQREKDWPNALQAFRSAEAAARKYSPPAVKNAELSHAWRGIGYVLVEQNQLDEAEKMYRQCLDLDKNDVKAQDELGYIQELRVKQGIGRAPALQEGTAHPMSK